MTGSPAATRDQVPASDEAQESREDAAGPGVASRVLSTAAARAGPPPDGQRQAAHSRDRAQGGPPTARHGLPFPVATRLRLR